MWIYTSTPSWRSASLVKHRDNFTQYILSQFPQRESVHFKNTFLFGNVKRCINSAYSHITALRYLNWTRIEILAFPNAWNQNTLRSVCFPMPPFYPYGYDNSPFRNPGLGCTDNPHTLSCRGHAVIFPKTQIMYIYLFIYLAWAHHSGRAV
jgi:hypothetical protein